MCYDLQDSIKGTFDVSGMPDTLCAKCANAGCGGNVDLLASCMFSGGRCTSQLAVPTSGPVPENCPDLCPDCHVSAQ